MLTPAERVSLEHERSDPEREPGPLERQPLPYHALPDRGRQLADAAALALAALRELLDRLDAWRHGAKVSQVAAEVRHDTVSAEGHYNTVRNYTRLIDQARAAIAALQAAGVKERKT